MRKKDRIVFLFFSLFVGLFPLVVASIKAVSHYIDVMIFAGIFSLVSIGLCLLMGYAGQISLAQAAFMGIGAYCSGILTTHYGWPSSLALMVGLVVTGVVAYGVGVPSLKLKGHYLAMATLGFGMIVHIVLNEEVELTGGPSGLVGISGLGIGNFQISSPFAWYYLVWGCVATVMLFSLNLVRSRIGRAFLAIHADERAAQAMGVDVSNYKVKVFVLSALLASFAGSLYAHYVEFLNPGSFGLMWSIKFVLMVMVGGIQNLWGAVIGTVFLTFLSNEWLHFLADFEVLIYGLILLVIAMFIPQGLVTVVATKLLKKGLRDGA
ncbi:MAG: branched-chain amino acid ABC transporter permease [Deltaproteobacteria bacterium]|nr:branched-chain amino acid ABC transporter permease [Deltaproteobacteria bacterium]MBW2069338.1 branched-chain amino acid ABC transporter permease [Deltaproteobacteria bacterium]